MDLSLSNSLVDLRERLIAGQELVVRAARATIEHALAFGDLLLEAKAHPQLKHGQWLGWLESIGIPPRMAQRYTRIARNRAKLEAKYDTVSPLGIRAALALLAGRSINTGVGMDPYEERGDDLYETPEGATLALLAREKLTGTIWEPCCGPGAIVRVLRERGHSVVASNLIDWGCPDSTSGVDFLAQQSAPDGVTTILSNIPYKHANDMVPHALDLLPNGRVILLLRLLFLESQGRSDILQGGRLARVHVFKNRLPIHRHGWEGPHDSNPMALAWFVWEPAHNGRPELHWLSYAPAPEKTAPPDDGLDIPDYLRRAT
jgi:hypothetical protein